MQLCINEFRWYHEIISIVSSYIGWNNAFLIIKEENMKEQIDQIKENALKELEEVKDEK